MLRRTISAALAMLLCALLLPVLFAGTGSGGGDKPAPTASAQPRSSPAPAPTPAAEPVSRDAETGFALLTDGGAVYTTLREYLPLALAAEMPASFEAEALKAQAVALRTYALHRMETGCANHGEALCTSSACCQAYTTEDELRGRWGEDYGAYMEKMRSAVSATDGQYLVCGGEIILAAFHSSSSGQTEDSGDVWLNSLPYLCSVTSPENAGAVPNFRSEVTVSASDFKATLLSAHPEAQLAGDASLWLGEVSRTGGGRVAECVIGGAPVAGTELRSLFSLRSADFTLEYAGGDFIFAVEGYGHGVGMSQYGANVMAREGSDYIGILTHYYTGVELVSS